MNSALLNWFFSFNYCLSLVLCLIAIFLSIASYLILSIISLSLFFLFLRSVFSSKDFMSPLFKTYLLDDLNYSKYLTDLFFQGIPLTGIPISQSYFIFLTIKMYLLFWHILNYKSDNHTGKSIDLLINSKITSRPNYYTYIPYFIIFT